ncbi:uncharacterized protein LOC132703198 [Cylas formicarius]|uniref:uncharacterized protein LOC132703198 n=1 Tax=Cylas formicarius TaxID=197179 RepID=UPI002958DAAF|nr:uncharacterized protein LOC132703198 [Cylas formicarius]
MLKQCKRHSSELLLVKLILISLCVKTVTLCDSEVRDESVLDKELKNYVDRVLKDEGFSVIPGVVVERIDNADVANSTRNGTVDNNCETGRSVEDFESYVERKIDQYVHTHALSLNFEQTARFLTSSTIANVTVFLGAQLIKSVLIAMFLPTILGSVGKLVGKGLSTFSGLSSASAGFNKQHQEVEDFDFNEGDPYSNDAVNDIHGDGDSLKLNSVDSSTIATNSRFDFAHNRIYTAPSINDNYYLRRPNKKTDYKVFHKIPSSSLLLTSYDPFYSPLLSRLDAIFQQLGLPSDKRADTERCRERLVCMMYANPAKYAPYSNLVSAQLSRELNELRKPSSDNPDILRFFRYMKAAKDGQDGEQCLAHGGCPSLNENQPSPALLTTFNEINKLVQARKLSD